MAAHVYTLTSLTGRNRNADRRIVIYGFDMRRRSLIVVSIAVGASLLPAILAAALFGPLAFLIVPAVFVAAAFVLFEARTRKGLQVRVYQSLLDKRRADVKELYICWRPVAETLGRAMIRASSLEPPVRNEDATPAVYTAPVPRTQLRGASVASLLEV